MIKENLKSQFQALYCMVLADGIVDAKELTTLYRIGKENYGLSAEEINNAVVGAGTSFYLPATLEGRIEILYHLCEIAWADGTIDDTERGLLKKYARYMGFQDENLDGIVEYLLEKVKNGTSLEEIKKEIA